MPADNDKIIQGEVLPPESRGVTLPRGTPFGFAIFGAARFSAVRRVIEQYERALQAKEAAILAEGAVATAIVRREIARAPLQHLDQLREEEGDRITHEITLNKLRRQLEKMELEDEIAERTVRRKELAEKQQSSEKNQVSDQFTAFMDDLRRLPDIVNAVATAKSKIVESAGGEDHLSGAQQQACEMFDFMLQTFLSKKGEAAL